MPDERSQPSSSLRPGTILDGRYEILSRIGAGGMGEVFRARDLSHDALRCIKTMKPSLLASDAARMRFLREARLATQLDHPNIARVCDFSADGRYLVTELVDGVTVRQWIAANGAFPIAMAVDVAIQILAGLEHIHARGLVHRDLSPDNVMLSRTTPLVATIIDLGLLKDLHASGASTQSGVLVGNPKYMSPEQLGILGEDSQVDSRTDLYSLGALLYEMVAGVAPFVSDTPQGYVMQHLTQMPPRLKHVPDRLEHVIFRALEKQRNRRYADAKAFAEALAPLRNLRDAREAIGYRSPR